MCNFSGHLSICSHFLHRVTSSLSAPSSRRSRIRGGRLPWATAVVALKKWITLLRLSMPAIKTWLSICLGILTRNISRGVSQTCGRISVIIGLQITIGIDVWFPTLAPQTLLHCSICSSAGRESWVVGILIVDTGLAIVSGSFSQMLWNYSPTLVANGVVHKSRIVNTHTKFDNIVRIMDAKSTAHV